MAKEIVAVFEQPNEGRLPREELKKIVKFINGSTVCNHEIDAKLVITDVYHDGCKPTTDDNILITVREWK